MTTATAERPAGDTATALVVYDPVTKSIDIPTNVDGLVLKFAENQTQLTATQLHILAPLGIRADWSPPQVLVFLMTCRERGFDPWAREAYLMRYTNSNMPDGYTYSFHIGIDGFRGKAEDSGEYRGVEGPLYSDDGVNWFEVWPDATSVPPYTKAGVKRLRVGEPMEIQWARISYAEYAPMKDEWVNNRKTGNRVYAASWKPAVQGGMPMVMAGKCAEAAAFRKAFPRRFKQFYEPAEMERLIAEAKTDAPDPVTAAREAAFAAAHPKPAGTETPVDAVVVAETIDLWAQYGGEDAARVMLLAEIVEMAAIVRKPFDDFTAQLRGTIKKPATDGTAAELLRFTKLARRHIVRGLKDDGRTDEAAVYEQAPLIGDCAVLFGRGPAATMAEAAA